MDTEHAIRSGKLVRKAHDCHRRSVRLSRDSKKRKGFKSFGLHIIKSISYGLYALESHLRMLFMGS